MGIPRRRLLLSLAIAVALTVGLGASAEAHGCGKYQVLPGERKVVVLERCGEPWWREIVGWQRAENGWDVPVEEFWYETPHGVHHVLTFVGPVLVGESSVRKP